MPSRSTEIAQWQALREGLRTLALDRVEETMRFATLLGEGHDWREAAEALQLTPHEAYTYCGLLLSLARVLEITEESA